MERAHGASYRVRRRKTIADSSRNGCRGAIQQVESHGLVEVGFSRCRSFVWDCTILVVKPYCVLWVLAGVTHSARAPDSCILTRVNFLHRESSYCLQSAATCEVRHQAYRYRSMHVLCASTVNTAILMSCGSTYGFIETHTPIPAGFNPVRKSACGRGGILTDNCYTGNERSDCSFGLCDMLVAK